MNIHKKIILCVFCFCSLSGVAQNESFQGTITQEEYLLQMIDSLSRAEANRDTATIIQVASLLTTSLQDTGLLDRATSYLQLAFRHARAFSDSTMYADVCNRAGMLMVCFRGKGRKLIPEKMDSSLYWHREAVRKGFETRNLSAAAWGYRGLLMTTVMLFSRNRISEYGDSIPVYYNKAIALADSITEGQDLILNCSSQYGFYLVLIKDWPKAKSIFEMQATKLDGMSVASRRDYYTRLHDYLSAANGLDTLSRLKVLLEQLNLQMSTAQHIGKLHEKDQQYEVSKTKNILLATASRLETINTMLAISLGVLIVFGCLITYLFLLFRKNKRLSQRNELLLREQNHRVKNNLQMISSLLSLQSQKLLSADAKDALQASQNRINSVALLHRMLYEGEQVGKVEVITYFRSLIEEIQYSSGRKMKVELDFPDKLELKIEKVTSLGLIVNELFTNSIKHVDGATDLYIRLSLTIDAGKLNLSYTDNGHGMDSERWMSSKTFGNQLIRIQSQQLHGEFTIRRDPGFTCDLVIYA